MTDTKKFNLMFSNVALYEWCVGLAKRLKITTIEELVQFIDYYKITSELGLLQALINEVDEVYDYDKM